MNKVLSLRNAMIGLLVASGFSVLADGKPRSIEIAEGNGIEVIESFPTPNGMTGWLVKNRKGHNVWYSDDKGYVFVGAFISPEGENLTAQYLEDKAPKQDIQALVESSTFVSTHPNAKKSNPVYVFYEPHCGFCSAFHAAAKPYIENGHEVRWIPVAFLARESQPGKPSSAELVASILSAEDKNGVIDRHEQLKQGGSSGLALGGVVTPEIVATIQHNSDVMNQLGVTGTPAMVFVNANGQYEVLKGFPSMDKIPDLFHSKRMDSSDPRLGRFGANPMQYPVK